MDIFVNKMHSPTDQKEGKPKPRRREKRRERRKAGRDRRKSVNEGLVVSLSNRNDRRTYRERRHQHMADIEFQVPAESEEKTKEKSFSVIA